MMKKESRRNYSKMRKILKVSLTLFSRNNRKKKKLKTKI